MPFVSYPYEWPFTLLKRAALLQLDLLVDAIGAGLMLKDGTPYNVQWDGPRPVFIDVGSFERLRPGEPWAGYRQFCRLQLFPLMLQAFRDVPFQPLLRGRLEGIEPAELRNLLSFRDRLRRGVLTHVVLHARLERRYAAGAAGEVRGELRRAGFNEQLVLANARRLRRIVDGLDWRGSSEAWGDYARTCGYGADDAALKAAFVREAAAARPRLVWDLGCNDGTYSRIAAEHAAAVVAVDADPAVADRLAREGHERILPLVVDLADPSPSLGWGGAERGDLAARGRPDLVLALALVHHLAITRNLPLAGLVDWLAGLGGAVVVEFVDRSDPMAARLLAAKREGVHDDYSRAAFERLLAGRFEVERSAELAGGARVLYRLRPRR